jgi:hypothetical protein
MGMAAAAARPLQLYHKVVAEGQGLLARAEMELPRHKVRQAQMGV